MALTDKHKAFCAAYADTASVSEAYRISHLKPASIGSGYYVSLLTEPRDDEVFYVGKGKGGRFRDHVKDARAGRIANVEKHRRIVDIHESGNEVRESIFFASDSEREAFSVERGLIVRLAPHGLTNILGGVTTNAEVAQEKARHALLRMKSYEQWISSTSRSRIDAVARMAGSARAFYDDHVQTLTRYASGDLAS